MTEKRAKGKTAVEGAVVTPAGRNSELISIPSKRRRTQGGESSTECLVSSHLGDNSELFPKILDLYVADGSTIADVTYGTGVFWKNVDFDKYVFFPSDLKTGVDARKLPYEDESLDAFVLDPPYMEGLYRKTDDALAGSGSHAAFREYYSDSSLTHDKEIKYHDKVLDMYLSIGIEARRTLRDKGVFIVKCQDEVSANRQKLTHVELIYAYEKVGFYCKDLFVLTRSNKPVVARVKKQEHARKNHSYFLIFVLNKKKKLPYSNFRDFLLSYSQANGQ